MIENEEEDDDDDKMSPPEPKKNKTEMVSKKFHWTEWDQKLEGDRVKGKRVNYRNKTFVLRGTYGYIIIIL